MISEIDDPARIPEIVSRAYYTATSGRPGPVVIALPEDMLTDRVTVPDATAYETVETWPGLTDMSRLQKLLWAAKKQVVLVGGSGPTVIDRVLAFGDAWFPNWTPDILDRAAELKARAEPAGVADSRSTQHFWELNISRERQ